MREFRDERCVRASPPISSRALRGAQRVAVLTGAGVSAESGVPTFRDAQTGLWARFDPRELATPSAFARNPKLVWDWYAMRRAMVADVAPNAGHFALAALEPRVPDFLLATQNVDGLHQRAGSRRVVELHGNITRVKCSRCGAPAATWDEPAADAPPRCAHVRRATCAPTSCGSRRCCLRTRSPPAERRGRDAATCCSSSARRPRSIRPPRCRCARAACGARVVEVNPGATPLSRERDDTLRGPAGVVLPALVAAAFPDRVDGGADGADDWPRLQRLALRVAQAGEDRLAVGRDAEFAVARARVARALPFLERSRRWSRARATPSRTR